MKHFWGMLLSICFMLSATVMYAANGPEIVTQQLTAGYVNQDKDYWCWAASAENAIRWEMSPTRTQWDAVRYLKGEILNWYPDVPGSIYDSARAAIYISNDTESYNATTTSKTFEFIREQISNRHPIITGAGYYSSGTRVGGHATLVMGWSTTGGVNQVIYYDSALGTYEKCTYAEFCNGTFNGRRYDQTCYNTGN